MPWVRARRYDEGPLTEFPASRRVEFKRIPLPEAQQTTWQVCKVGYRAPPLASNSNEAQTTRNGDQHPSLADSTDNKCARWSGDSHPPHSSHVGVGASAVSALADTLLRKRACTQF